MQEPPIQHSDDKAGRGVRRYRQDRRRPAWAAPPVPAPEAEGGQAAPPADLFGCSDAETQRVVLRLGPRATRILMEEFGVRDWQLVIDADPSRRLFATSVRGCEGVGRFVLGLVSDIEVVRGDGLRQWLVGQLREGLRRLLATPAASPGQQAEGAGHRERTR